MLIVTQDLIDRESPVTMLLIYIYSIYSMTLLIYIIYQAIYS